MFGIKNRAIKVFIVSVSLLIFLICGVLASMLFAGHTTREYALCDRINDVEVDFDSPNIHGIYSEKVASFVTRLELKVPGDYYGCTDNLKDNLIVKCDTTKSYLNAKVMSGRWKLSNRSYYTDPYGIHLGPNHKMYYVGLEQNGMRVHIPLFTLMYLYPPFMNSLKQKDLSDDVRVLRELACK